MSEPTITNTLDEEMLASTPDAVFLHSIVSIPYTVYGLLTYSVSQLEVMIQETLTAIDQYITASNMANSRTTVDGDVPLRKIKALSDLHNRKTALVSKRTEAHVRIKNRLGLIVEAYENLHTETPLPRSLWNKALYRLCAYYEAQYLEDYDRRYLVYVESLKTKTYIPPSVTRDVTLSATRSNTPRLESAEGPFSISGESFTVTADGVPYSYTLPDSTSASLTYTGGVFNCQEDSSPYVMTSGYSSTSKEIATGTCNVLNGTVTILTGDPVGNGLAVGDVFRVVDGTPYSDLYVQSILSDTQIVLTVPPAYGPVYSGIAYTAFYRPELVVVLDGVSETWDLSLSDITASAVSTTLNAQSPPWTASAVGGQLKIEGPDVGSSHTIITGGRSSAPYGFPVDGGDYWIGTDDNSAVEFEIDGAPVTKTLTPGSLTVSDLATLLAPAPGENYTVTVVGTDLVLSTTSYGSASELHWVTGLGLDAAWYYGSDVTIADIIAAAPSGLSITRGVGTAPTLVLSASESLLCSTNPLGFSTTATYGSRAEVDYTGIMENDTWEGSALYTWNGEYVDPSMSFSESADVQVSYGGAAAWQDVYDHLNVLHGYLTPPDLSRKESLEKIKIFLQEFATGIGKYTKPVYPSIQYLLESLEEGQYTRLVQELVVFDLAKALDMALIGRKDLNYVAEVLPSRVGSEGGTERGSYVPSVISVSEDTSSDTYFDLEDDPTALEFPDSLVRY